MAMKCFFLFLVRTLIGVIGVGIIIFIYNCTVKYLYNQSYGSYNDKIVDTRFIVINALSIFAVFLYHYNILVHPLFFILHLVPEITFFFEHGYFSSIVNNKTCVNPNSGPSRAYNMYDFLDNMSNVQQCNRISESIHLSLVAMGTMMVNGVSNHTPVQRSVLIEAAGMQIAQANDSLTRLSGIPNPTRDETNAHQGLRNHVVSATIMRDTLIDFNNRSNSQ